MRPVLSLALTVGLLAAGAACGDDESSAAGSSGRPQVVVTTNILGDIVNEVVGDEADVEVIMPLGADPHSFEPSARQAEAMEAADLLVVNGAGFEDGMLGVIESAGDAGAPLFVASEHAGGEVEDDPHIWTDPTQMIAAVEALAERVAEIEGVDADATQAQAVSYVTELEALDAEVEALLGAIPDERRKLVTNHDVFGYFADRYDLEVIGAVIPSLSTQAQPSAGDIQALVDQIEHTGVKAIYPESSINPKLEQAVARESGATTGAPLWADTLGPEGSTGATYIDSIAANTKALVEGLSGGKQSCEPDH
jgi:zinc/manganese transport system substrate-binding protein